jgi:hypothetical protein
LIILCKFKVYLKLHNKKKKKTISSTDYNYGKYNIKSKFDDHNKKIKIFLSHYKININFNYEKIYIKMKKKEIFIDNIYQLYKFSIFHVLILYIALKIY